MSSQGRGRARGRGRPVQAAVPEPGTPHSLQRAEPAPHSLQRAEPGPSIGGSAAPAPSTSKAPSAQFKDAETGKPTAPVVPFRGERAKRPGYGKNAVRTIPLLVNYFNLKLPTGVVYQYDIEIVHERTGDKGLDKKKQRDNRIPLSVTKHVFNELVKGNKEFAKHQPVYDGNKTLVTRYPLDEMISRKDFRVTIQEVTGKSSFYVTVKPALTGYGNKREVDLDSIQRYVQKKQDELPLDSIRMMDLIFRHGPMMKLATLSRSFFLKPTRDEDVPPFGGGREIWFGYTQSVRPTEWGPLLNVDITATVFYKEGPILDFVKQVLGFDITNRSLDQDSYKKLKSELTGIRVRSTHSPIPRRYTIAGLFSKGANEIRFPLEGGSTTREVTVEQYFFEQYKYRLRYPSLPCLQVQPKTKRTYLPMEVCTMLPEQHCKRTISDTQRTMMIRKTCKSPQLRFKEIQARLDETHKLSAPYLNYFGIELGRKPVEVNSRVLKAPAVVYAQPDILVPDKGAWNIADHKFFRAVTISHWLVMNFGYCQVHELHKFAKMLQTEGSRLGMKIAPAMDVKDVRGDQRLGAEEILRRSKKLYPNLELVVLVIPSRSDRSNYAEIKKAGDVELGLVTQCIKDVNVSKKCNPSLLGNLCQKINAKLGGINNTVVPEKQFRVPALFDEPVIVMGADVTHPSVDDHAPSVAAVVGSLDRYPSRFAARVQVQKSTLGGIQSRVELILDLKTMVQDLLKQFYKETKQKPQKIYFFRDGVSETQFPEVLHYEVNQIRQACTSLQADYKPSLTFLCVQKRHHTRFCPKNQSDACGKAGNVPPGTTVDTGIVSPMDFDFYLCSHFGLQGTSRPTHYSVLLDENNLSADQVQALCYHLCHTYARCTRSLSIPTPVQYAHLAAFRARSHLGQLVDYSSGSSSGGSGSCRETSFENEDKIEQAVKVIANQLNQMYFV